MVVIGVDAHKRTHTLVAVDELGRKLGERTVATTSEGHLLAAQWAGQWPGARFALEDCRHLTRRLEGDLLRAGFAVVRVHTRLMAAARRGGRERGKSDPIDALAVAHAALREPDLPAARLDGPARTVKLLSDHRQDLMAERTRLCSRLRWHLHELDPGLQVPSRGLRRYHVLDGLSARLAAMDGIVARIAAELVIRCRELTRQVNALERELGVRNSYCTGPPCVLIGDRMAGSPRLDQERPAGRPRLPRCPVRGVARQDGVASELAEGDPVSETGGDPDRPATVTDGEGELVAAYLVREREAVVVVRQHRVGLAK
jgi:transposase